MSIVGKLGLLVAGVGAAHFVAPEAFEDVTKIAFPQETDKWVLRDGASEVLIGSLMVLKPTRKLGVVALLGYAGWLGYNATNAAENTA
jgi:uncharacterized membrane protein